jgi:aryl-alcohol dehydrogenase-like predicted oxidoreductase
MTTQSANTQVQQTRLGRTERNVSRIAFGTWQLGGDWGATDEQAAIGAIRHAYDRGINFFDTAQGYGFGASEQLLAKAIHGLPRDSVVIATKGGLRPLGGPRVERDASQRGSARVSTTACERSQPSTSICSRCTGPIPRRRSRRRPAHSPG